MFWDQNPPKSITNPSKSINLSESPKRGGLQDPRCKPSLAGWFGPAVLAMEITAPDLSSTSNHVGGQSLSKRQVT